MPLVDFDSLPDSARLWVFPASRDLDDSERAFLLAAADSFLEGWAAHGVPLAVGRDWRHQRFLLVAVDEAAAEASGCSLDDLARALRNIEDQLGVSLTDYSPVVYWQNGEICSATRLEFTELAARDVLGPHTIVFDNTVTSVRDLRQGRWQLAAGESWHRRLLGVEWR
jgi:hypothetical protein